MLYNGEAQTCSSIVVCLFVGVERLENMFEMMGLNTDAGVSYSEYSTWTETEIARLRTVSTPRNITAWFIFLNCDLAPRKAEFAS